MEESVANLAATLKRSSVPADTKIAQFNTLKSQIKHQRVPESAQSTIVDCVRLAITAQTSSALVLAGFSALGHLVKRLTIQDQTGVLYAQRHSLLQSLLERLGDAREQYRTAASQALCDLWPPRQADVEKVVREGAIQGSNARAKEAGMQWVAKMHAEQGLQFRNFVPAMIECLEDADGQVREAAKATIIELFSTARDAAKADLKRQLVAFNVRRSIASHILTELHISNSADFEPVSRASVIQHAAARPETPAQDATLAHSTSSEVSHPPHADSAHIEPLYVSSQRELDDLFRQMHPAFEDKETEDNWRIREANVLKMRRLLKGNAPQDYLPALLSSIKNTLDGILKVVNTLRTTMATNGCQLVQELAITLGPALDPMVEILLQGFEKMSASTKHINAQNANTTVDTIFARVSYHQRLMQHIWMAAQDKNVQPRQFAAGWLKTILRRQILHKAAFEHSGGVDMAEKTIKKGLLDANPKVRETVRGTYWLFAQTWPERGESIMSSLDAKSKQLLEKDPANPNGASASSAFTVSVGPGAAGSVSGNVRAAGSRQSLKETIAAQRKASLAAKRAPERPTSAMSTFSPVKEAPSSVVRPTPSTVSTARSRPAPPSATVANAPTRPALASSVSAAGQGSLSSAPMRRPRRPDVPRPATADLYASRQRLKADTPPRSPVPSPPRQTRPSNLGGPHIRPDSAASMRGSGRTSRTNSPRISPMRSRSRAPPAKGSAPGRAENGPLSPLAHGAEDNFTMVFPAMDAIPRAHSPPTEQQETTEKAHNDTSLTPPMADDDNFTLVIPTRQSASAVLPPPNTQIDLLPTIEDEPTKTLTLPILHSATMTNSLTDTIDLAQPLSTLDLNSTSPTQQDQLIVFEDPAAEDSIVPATEVSPTRAALEELQPSDRNQQNPVVDGDHDPKNVAAATSRARSRSPIKKIPEGKADELLPDRTEVLKTRRLFASGIERVKARTLDIHGFRKVQELIKSNAHSDDLRFDELYSALMDFIKSVDDDPKVNSVKAHALKLQALVTLRLLQSQGVGTDKISDTLTSLLIASGLYEKNSHLALDLQRTAEDTLARSQHASAEHIKAILPIVEANSASKGIVVSSLNILGKIFASMRGQRQHLDAQCEQRLGKLARRCFNDLDADVRRANTQFCLEWHALVGKEEEQSFWKALGSVPEAQLNLLAYYVARRNAAAATA